jgi:multidrug efflux pump subunit AcrA (membrane-fusion protein)
MMKKIPQDGNITAPVDGIIKSIMVEKGMICNAGQTIFELGRKSSSVTVEWQMNTEKASTLNVGDKVTFIIKSLDNSSIEGKVKEKQYSINTGMYRFTSDISVEGNSPEDSSEVEIRATKQSANYQFIVPNGSISGQEGKKYVFVVKERDGILGKETYVTMVDVKVEDSDDINSAISGTINSGDKIVIFSSKALMDEAQVKLR